MRSSHYRVSEFLSDVRKASFTNMDVRTDSSACSCERSALQQEHVLYRRSAVYKLSFQDGFVTWEKTEGHGIEKEHKHRAVENYRKSVPIQRVLATSVNVDTDKRKCNPGEGTESGLLTVHYVEEVSKQKLKVEKIVFYGPQNVCRQCAESIRGLIKLHELSRPKKLLVFINPQSGSKTGEKIYRRKVAPLFSLCEIQTKVIVTQTENHSKDVLRETDLSDYDGIVCVGGDGTLSEIANGYLQRCYRDGHIDWDNPETVLPRPRLPIGVIPTGSGDTIVRFMNETRSVTTATIHIILGRTRGIDFGSVHNRHKLLSYTCLLIGYGLYGRLIEAIEIRRWLPGRIRYSVIPMIELLNVRSFDVKVQMLKPVIEKESQEGNTSHGNRDPEKTRIQPDTKWEWSNQYEGPLLGVDSFIVHLMPVGNSMRPYMGNGLAQVTLVKNCSRISHLSHLIKLMDRSPGFYDYDFIEEHNVKGYRVEAFPKSQGRRIPEMYLMNCDGDLIKLEEPCFEVRVHKELIKLFTWIDEDWPEWVETKSETLSR